MPPKYSICITCFNEAKTIRRSIKSILNQINEGFELIVVDNYSNDGTFEALEETGSTQIKLLRRKCRRGKGRQIAFENSTGKYIIANMDMDDTFKPVLQNLLDSYHRKCDGKLLAVFKGSLDQVNIFQNITVGPRDIIRSIGGWRNLQWGEDWDLWCRAGKINKYSWTLFTLTEGVNFHPERNKLTRKMLIRFRRYSDDLNAGRNVFYQGEKVNTMQRLMYLMAKLSRLSDSDVKDPYSKTFDPYSSSHFVDFGSLDAE